MVRSPWFRLVVVSAVALPAFADQAGKRALIGEMLALTKADALIQAVLEQQRGAIREQMQQTIDSNRQLQPYAQDLEPLVAEYEGKTLELLRKTLDWTSLKPQLVAIYEDVFSEEELAGVVAFYRTPAGQAFLRKMPDLMSRTMQTVQQEVQVMVPEMQRLTTELAREAAKIAAAKAK